MGAACSGDKTSKTATLGSGSPGETVELATFTGTVDATGKITFVTTPSAASDAISAAWAVLPPWADGHPGTNPDNTFEIRTLTSGEGGGYGTNPDGCGTGQPSYYGVIRLQSFFRNQQLDNVYAEIIGVTPTGHAGCGTMATPPAGTDVSAAYGLWSYGSVGRKGSGSAPFDHVDATWNFQYQTPEPFSFTGRIVGSLSAPVAIGGPAFDWTPTSLVDPPRTFREIGTTVAHISWSAADNTFRDSRTGKLFHRVGGSGGGSVSSGLTFPAQSYRTFGDGSYWVEDPVGLTTSAFALARGFTVCAKIKPAALPTTPKAIFAKGNPVLANGGSHPLGFALVEAASGMYRFYYRTPDNNAPVGNEIVAYISAGANPENSAYDYICGGRADWAPNPTDGRLYVQAHGAEENYSLGPEGTGETGEYDGSTLALAIGATADGQNPAGEMGLYEVIIDSRGATPDVMREIVAAAEGWALPGSSGFSAIYLPQTATQTAVTGADGGSYTLPPYATVAVSTDGSGLLAEGVVLQYTHPLTANTETSGFCLGAEVVPDGAWSGVTGTIFSFTDHNMAINVNPVHWDGDSWNPPGALPAWDPGSAHSIVACASPPSGTNRFDVFADGVSVTGAVFQSAVIPNLGLSNGPDGVGGGTLGIGGVVPGMSGGAGTLSGARIRRVFACANPNPASCR